MSHDSQTVFLTPPRIILILGVLGIVAGLVGASLARDVSVVRLFDNLHWTAGALTAALLAWFGVRSAQPGSVRGLRWIALGLTAYAVGQFIWNVQVLIGYDGFPSPSDLFFLLLGPFVAVGLLVEAFRLADRVQRKTLLLDAANLGITVTTLILVLYLLNRPDLALLQLAVLVAYPASLVAAACVGLVAALMVIMNTAVGIAVSVFATGYFGPSPHGPGGGHPTDSELFWPLWFMLWGALNALFLSGDVFNLYVTLELVGLSGVGLISLAGRKAWPSAMRYLLVSLLASLSYLLGAALLYSQFGVLGIAELGRAMTDVPAARAAAALMLVGLAAKTALERNSGRTTACIIGSLAPRPGQPIITAVKKANQNMVQKGIVAPWVKRIYVKDTPEKTENCPMMVRPYLGLTFSAKSPIKPTKRLLMAVPMPMPAKTSGALPLGWSKVTNSA